MNTKLEEAFMNSLVPIVVGAQLAVGTKKTVDWSDLIKQAFDTFKSQVAKCEKI